jgi:hypothetical protein
MRVTPRRSILIAFTALAVVLSLGLLVWISGSIRERPMVDAARVARTAESDRTESSSPVATPELETSAPARTEIAKPALPRAEPTPNPAPAASAARDGVTLIANFVRPDFKELEVAHATVELRDSRGAVRSVTVEHKSFARFSSLAPDVYVAHVAASELEHREETLDLGHASKAKKGHEGEIVVERRIVLWPADWVAVLVETTDGRALSALAADLESTPARLFAKAFQMRTQLDPPAAIDAQGVASERGLSRQATASTLSNASVDAMRPDASRPEATLARYHPSQESQRWELPKSCVGALELVHPPPMWVALDLFGEPLGWELLGSSTHEVAFRIDRAAFENRFARVTVRVVDPENHAAVANALVTLRADTSAFRRPDITNVPSGSDGRVEFSNVVPGRYELSIARGDSQFQQMIQLERGERRDLGDIALGEAGAFEVVVLDATGVPTSAFVEIGPYEKGARSGDLYPQMMRHQADERGRERLPMPSGRAIVRAAIEIGRSNDARSVQEIRGVRSANVLLDPRALPALPLRLTLQTPVKVHLATSRSDVARIEVLDELDLVVARSVHEDKKLDAELVPGRYRARTISADGSTGTELAFVADGKQSKIVLD